VGITGCALSYLGVAGLRRWAEQGPMLDIPNNRSSHLRPTPRGGGLAIAVVTLGGWLALGVTRRVELWPALLAYPIGAALIAGVSWIDDLRSLSNRVRFATHSLAAMLAIWSYGYWHTVRLPLVGDLGLGLFGPLLSFFWIVSLTNAYNFMDGIDGIAGSQAVVAGLGWAMLGWIAEQPMVGALGLLVASSSLGFLGHNWPPARIFMGDVGSAFLGYTLAVLPFVFGALPHTRGEWTELPIASILLVWPFVFDTTFTLLRRLSRGENVFAAHRSHLYQRLNIIGYGHRFVTLIYIGLAIIGAILALCWSLGIRGSSITVPSVALVLCLILWSFVVNQEHKRIAQAQSALPEMSDSS
jgi:UDP-N-acetylmuramyl pentapeptide phosphotransferase/UDP-N-acetylglucosamine-1-phosphate transferase